MYKWNNSWIFTRYTWNHIKSFPGTEAGQKNKQTNLRPYVAWLYQIESLKQTFLGGDIALSQGLGHIGTHWGQWLWSSHPHHTQSTWRFPFCTWVASWEAQCNLLGELTLCWGSPATHSALRYSIPGLHLTVNTFDISKPTHWGDRFAMGNFSVKSYCFLFFFFLDKWIEYISFPCSNLWCNKTSYGPALMEK